MAYLDEKIQLSSLQCCTVAQSHSRTPLCLAGDARVERVAFTRHSNYDSSSTMLPGTVRKAVGEWGDCNTNGHHVDTHVYPTDNSVRNVVVKEDQRQRACIC